MIIIVCSFITVLHLYVGEDDTKANKKLFHSPKEHDKEKNYARNQEDNTVFLPQFLLSG